MPLNVDLDSPDSLQTLLDKAHVVINVNQENLDEILSRNGQQVIISHKCDLRTYPPLAKSYKKHCDSQSNENNKIFNLVSNKSSKNIDDITSS